MDPAAAFEDARQAARRWTLTDDDLAGNDDEHDAAYLRPGRDGGTAVTSVYRIETTAIASVTLYVEADDEEAALTLVRAANDEGATAVRSLLASCGGAIEAESLALDTAFVERDDL